MKNSLGNQYHCSDRDSNFDLEQTHGKNPSSTFGYYPQASGQPDTIYVPDISTNVIVYPSLRLQSKTYSNPLFLSKNTIMFDESGTILNGQDMEVLETSPVATNSPPKTPPSIPPQQPPTNTTRTSKQMPTASSILSSKELPGFATCQSSSRALGPAINSSPGDSLTSETQHQLGIHLDQHPKHSPSFQARESRLSPESSVKQFRLHGSVKGKSKIPTPSTVRRSLKKSASCIRSQDAQSGVTDTRQNPQTVFDDISSTTTNQCDEETLSTSTNEHNSLHRDRRAEIRKVWINRDREESEVAVDLSRKKSKCRSAAGKQAGSTHSDVDKISGWGWRARGDSDEWPRFEETKEICPIFDGQGQHVLTTLHGTFHFSRGQKGQVSNDGGELVHELQKRNIFHIKDIHYTLVLPSHVSTYLAVKYEGVPKRVQSLSIRLIARDFDGEFKHSRETPLETRGKAREFIAAREWNMTVALRPRKSGDNSPNVRFTRSLGQAPLPDVISAMHLEFRHATPGNKTMGIWRLPSQHYYRLVIQLYAKLDDVTSLVAVAERSTELLLVRGRPPGGREQAKKNASQTCVEQVRKRDRQSQKAGSCKKQKRGNHIKHKGEEDDLADGLAQDLFIESLTMSARGENKPQDTPGDIEGDFTSRHYNTRNACKRTSKESDADDGDSSDEDGEYDVDDGEKDYYEENIEERSKDELRAGPEDRHDDYFERRNRNANQYEVGSEGHHQFIDTNWCVTDGNYVPGLEHQLRRQIQQAAPQTFEGDSDDDDSIINDPMGLEAVIDDIFEETIPAQPAKGDLHLYSNDLDSNDPQHHAADETYSEPYISSNRPRAPSELPPMMSDHSHLQLRSRIPGPEISLNAVTPSNSNPESESSSSTRSPRKDDHYDQRNNPMEADFFIGLDSSHSSVLYDNFHVPLNIEDNFQEFPWSF